jgi:hypothetical protein
LIAAGVASLLFAAAPAVARPVMPTRPPQNPYLAPNPNSNIHNDTWMTDAYQRAGPAGRRLVTSFGSYPPSLCGSLAFDRKGRIVSVCPSSIHAPVVRVFDPNTLKVSASLDMPEAPDAPGTKQYQNFTGGGYFFLDNEDRIWSATKTSHLFVLVERKNGRKLVKVGDYDLTNVLNSDERVTSALPDFHGLIWFVSKRDGKVGVLNPKTRRIHALITHEEIENSFAVGRDGVYIVSDKQMYKFRTDRRGRPRIVWKAPPYKNSGIVKPSQVDAGSGTTPTLMAGGYVAITDNADPMDVVVYRNKDGRKVCQVPVFGRGASATENSLIAARRSLIVENNYGYQDPFGPSASALTAAGFARVDVRRNGRGCRKIWTNRTERAPTVVPKLSTKTGLIYAYTQNGGAPLTREWSWVAIDFYTGRRVFKKLEGVGPGYNNNYAGLAIGPTGRAYLGTVTGLAELRRG